MEGVMGICERFANLERAKKERIINAALKEFADQGYEQASTNKIVKKAGIGKGMLFYYFNSKRELFLYLVEYGLEVIQSEYLARLDEDESDFIEKCKQFGQVKMEAYTRHPHVFNFFGSLYISQERELPQELERRMLEAKQAVGIKLYRNIDTSLFRDDVPGDIIIKLIQWAMDGIEKEIVASLQGQQLASVDMDPYWDDFYDYLAVIRKLCYK